MASKQELAIIYSALILEDEGVQITTDKIKKLLQAADVQVEPFWPGLYVKALEGMKVSVSILCTPARIKQDTGHIFHLSHL